MLNEKVVLDFYLESLQRNEVSFLKSRSDLKSKTENLVLRLRDCENMHDKVHIAKELWKVLLEAAMTHIDPDKRGFDDLFRFFDEYVQFEELIFASDAFYRDHTIHCLWVYFLGEYLYQRPEYKFIFKDMFAPFRGAETLHKDLMKLDKPELFGETLQLQREFLKLCENGDSLRCLAALTHDLGYPLKKIRKINTSIGRILPYFSIDKFNEFDFHFNNTQMMFINDFIELLSIDFKVNMHVQRQDHDLIKKVLVFNNGAYGPNLNLDAFKELTEEELTRVIKILTGKLVLLKNAGHYLRYSGDFERHEHGILSAFLLSKTLGTFSDIHLRLPAPERIHLEDIDIYKVLSTIILLTAITDHTSKGYQIESINNPSALLTFVDELEEFSRISRANKNREYINEFCQTDIYVQDDYLQVDFTFDNSSIESLDPQLAFKGRCLRLLKLFKISSLDEDFRLKLRCIGKLPKDSNVYCIEIRRKYANITINGQEVDIPSYLKSSELYSKEQYMFM